MVSPAPPATQKPLALSYADRAKKAHNIHPQNSGPSQRVHSQSASVASTTAAASTASSTPTPVSHSTSELGSAKESSADGANNHLPPPLALPTPTSSGKADVTTKDNQGDVNSQHLDPPTTVAPVGRVQNPAAAPVVNVWNIRKEQMAQARAVSQPQVASSTQRPRVQNTQETANLDLPAMASSSSAVPNGLSASISSQKQTINGHAAGPHQQARKISPRPQPQRSPPSVEDAASWPTVSMSVAAPLQRPPGNDNNGLVEGGGVGSDEQRGTDDDTNGSGIAHKKSERPKWVPIPPEELQAAADAQRNRSSHRPGGHSRPRSQQQHNQGKFIQAPKPASGSVSTAASVSGQNSQGQSRAHSATGIRQPQSHSGSVSHSQSHSRTGSVHSSPRQQSFSRPSRRLPEDGSMSRPSVVDIVNPRNRSTRSSRAPSPGHSFQTDIDNLVPGVVSPDVANAGHPSGAIDQLQSYCELGQIHSEPYYSPVPPSLSTSNSRSQSYHSTHASNSPVTAPYGLPPVPSAPNMYPTPPPSLPGGYAGAPPYSMYAPYAFTSYGQPQPYIHWSTTGQGHNPTLYPVTHYHHSRSPSNQSGYSPAPAPNTNTVRDSQQQEGIPPPTMILRPPPPGQSDAVAGYREVGFFSPSPAAHSVAAEGSQIEANVARGRQAKEFSFGSIRRTVANKTPSPGPAPSPAVPSDASRLEDLNRDVAPVGVKSIPEGKNVAGEEGELGIEKPFTVFSIGVDPGEAGPSRIRSKTHPKSTGTSHERGNTAPAKLESEQSRESQDHDAGSSEGAEGFEGPDKVIDLTDSVTSTWEFGTTKQVTENRKAHEPHHEPAAPGFQPNGLNVAQPYPEEQSVHGMVPAPRPTQYAPPMQMPPLSIGPPNGITASASSPSAVSASYPPPNTSMMSPSGEHRMSADEWEVKNYGWGFGRGSNGPGLAPGTGRAERERDYPREYNPGRPRRGSYGGYGYDRGSHERGGYAGRRGRGVNGGLGRGYGSRNAPARGGYQQNQSPRPPFTVTQQPMGAEPGYYVPQQAPQGTTYFHPLGYDYAPYAPYVSMLIPATPAQPAPPVPIPQSLVSFPLDPTRYYLLGQLEYYLSAQNLAQDFYLRQRMDSRGWIPIPLIASFNRIKQLTTDMQLVIDVLTLSSLVEVKNDWVRVRSWQQYVLPTAAPSAVEDEYTYQAYAHPEFEEGVSSTSESVEHNSTDHEGEEEEVSEEEVEFVIGKEAQGSWTPERHTTAA